MVSLVSKLSVVRLHERWAECAQMLGPLNKLGAVVK